MITFVLGLIMFCLLATLVLFPVTKINWHSNYRQQQNIALYQQQMAQQPNAELAAEYAQRLLVDEQFAQLIQLREQNGQFSSMKMMALLWLILCAVPLLYYFSLQRFDYVQQGEQDFQQKTEQFHSASTLEKNDDYILAVQNELRLDPNNGERWIELGQAYMLSNEFDNALIAYGNAEKVLGAKPQILGLAATAFYYQAGQKMTEKVEKLTTLALQQDPNERASLSLLASNAFLTADYQGALHYWQRLLDSNQQGIERRAIIQSMQMAEQLDKAKQKQ